LALYNSIINQYLTYAQHIMYNVGGLYKNEIKSGDGQFRYKNIPAAEQKAALDYLFELWKDTDWIDDKSVLSHLPIVGSPKRSVQDAIESMIFTTPVLASFSDGVESRQYSCVDCLYDIADKVFAPSARSRKLSASERSMQANFVYTFMQMAAFPIPGTSSSNCIVSEDEQHCHHCESCWIQENVFSTGDLSYSPVNGFEWLPRYIFNMNVELTKADIYGVLQHCLQIMSKARQNASQADKVHYTTLIETINYSLKK
ncbi:MAG: zinc-dependent metalloprotease, partial [Candidatus Cryptobacteroides sp.]